MILSVVLRLGSWVCDFYEKNLWFVVERLMKGLFLVVKQQTS